MEDYNSENLNKMSLVFFEYAVQKNKLKIY